MIRYSRATRYSGLFCLATWIMLLLPLQRVAPWISDPLWTGCIVSGIAFIILFVADSCLWLDPAIGHNLDGVERRPEGEEWPKER